MYIDSNPFQLFKTAVFICPNHRFFRNIHLRKFPENQNQFEKASEFWALKHTPSAPDLITSPMPSLRGPTIESSRTSREYNPNNVNRQRMSANTLSHLESSQFGFVPSIPGGGGRAVARGASDDGGVSVQYDPYYQHQFDITGVTKLRRRLRSNSAPPRAYSGDHDSISQTSSPSEGRLSGSGNGSAGRLSSSNSNSSLSRWASRSLAQYIDNKGFIPTADTSTPPVTVTTSSGHRVNLTSGSDSSASVTGGLQQLQRKLTSLRKLVPQHQQRSSAPFATDFN